MSHIETMAEQDAEITRLQAENAALKRQNGAMLVVILRSNEYILSLQRLVKDHTALLTFANSVKTAIFKLAADATKPDPALPSLEITNFEATIKAD